MDAILLFLFLFALLIIGFKLVTGDWSINTDNDPWDRLVVIGVIAYVAYSVIN